MALNVGIFRSHSTCLCSPGLSVKALSRYSSDVMALPSFSNFSMKSRTVQMKEGKIRMKSFESSWSPLVCAFTRIFSLSSVTQLQGVLFKKTALSCVPCFCVLYVCVIQERILQLLKCMVVYGSNAVVDQSAAEQDSEAEDPCVMLFITL